MGMFTSVIELAVFAVSWLLIFASVLLSVLSAVEYTVKNRQVFR
jgi:hypothetical protein